MSLGKQPFCCLPADTAVSLSLVVEISEFHLLTVRHCVIFKETKAIITTITLSTLLHYVHDTFSLLPDSTPHRNPYINRSKVIPYHSLPHPHHFQFTTSNHNQHFSRPNLPQPQQNPLTQPSHPPSMCRKIEAKYSACGCTIRSFQKCADPRCAALELVGYWNDTPCDWHYRHGAPPPLHPGPRNRWNYMSRDPASRVKDEREIRGGGEYPLPPPGTSDERRRDNREPTSGSGSKGKERSGGF